MNPTDPTPVVPAADAPPQALQGSPLRRLDWCVASGLATLYVVLVMATTSMGWTRDESFYFHYGKVYFNWFMELARADDGEARDELLSQPEVDKVWRQNSEHPPLMKALFGTSWWLFGNKRRSAFVDPDGTVRIAGLGLAHGFEKGDQVPLYGPTPPEAGPEGAPKLGTLEIVSRTRHGARAQFVQGSHEDAATACLAEADAEHAWHGCHARSAGTLEFLTESNSFRFPGALFGGLLILLLYLFGVEMGGRKVALVAVLFLAFVPRAFFHAHLTCFDIPITALSFAVLYAFYKSLRSTAWAVAAAILWGLALLTKLNSFFLPITLLLWWAVAGLRSFRQVGWRVAIPPLPLAFLLMPLVGLPMLFLFWPWLWYDSIESFGKYLGFHLNHVHYFQIYFGQAQMEPPFAVHFPIVMTLVTVPLLTLLLGLAGSVQTLLLPVARTLRHPRTWWQRAGDLEDEWGRITFVAINMLFPLALISLPGTPVFGGVKHWLLTMPFFCLLAGHATLLALRTGHRGLRTLGLDLGPRLRTVAAALIVALVVAPGAVATVRYAAYGTGYYNELIHGLRGAAAHRMQRQFWSYAHRGTFPFLNRHAAPHAVIDVQDATHAACSMSQTEGWLRDDIKCVVRKHNPEWLVFDVEERFAEEEIRYWRQMDTLGPVHEAAPDGVPMARVYRRHAGFELMRKLITGGPDVL